MRDCRTSRDQHRATTCEDRDHQGAVHHESRIPIHPRLDALAGDSARIFSIDEKTAATHRRIWRNSPLLAAFDHIWSRDLADPGSVCQDTLGRYDVYHDTIR